MPFGGNDWLALTQEPTLEPEQYCVLYRQGKTVLRRTLSLWSTRNPSRHYRPDVARRVSGNLSGRVPLLGSEDKRLISYPDPHGRAHPESIDQWCRFVEAHLKG